MRRAGRVRIAAVHLAAFRVEQSPERPVLRTADSLVLAGWVRSAASAFRNWNFTDRFPAMNPKRGRSRRDPKRKLPTRRSGRSGTFKFRAAQSACRRSVPLEREVIVTSSVRTSYAPEGSRCPTADFKVPSKVDASNGLTRFAPVASALRQNASNCRTPGSSISA